MFGSEIIVFHNPSTNKIVQHSNRFYVNIWFNDEQSQIYFYPTPIWERIGPSLQPDFLIFPVESLSNTAHGMITNGYPYSKSPFYKSPFFLTFKTNQSIDSNFLTFNNFQIPNSYGTTLCMLSFNEDTDKFIPEFKAGIHLPFLKDLSLNTVLEFTIYDAQKKLVTFMDMSQLYICIDVL